MNPQYIEDMEVKIPGLVHFLRLGYSYQPIQEAISDKIIDYNSYIFKNRFKSKIEKINNITLSKKRIRRNTIRNFNNY